MTYQHQELRKRGKAKIQKTVPTKADKFAGVSDGFTSPRFAWIRNTVEQIFGSLHKPPVQVDSKSDNKPKSKSKRVVGSKKP